jgi:hypothetical protein
MSAPGAAAVARRSFAIQEQEGAVRPVPTGCENVQYRGYWTVKPTSEQ